MVRFVDEPFVTDAAARDLSVIKWKLLCGIGMTNVHFITLAENKNDIFDIYPAAVFKQKRFRKRDLLILGVAAGGHDAQDLTREMVQNCLDNCGDLTDIRGYFEKYVKDHL
ncbi:MAG: hypothetical protein IKO16_07120 [Lachnospiraceae bacterium]|nr:hypothetical protein [Lachnospiraceae bacterium]